MLISLLKCQALRPKCMAKRYVLHLDILSSQLGWWSTSFNEISDYFFFFWNLTSWVVIHFWPVDLTIDFHWLLYCVEGVPLFRGLDWRGSNFFPLSVTEMAFPACWAASRAQDFSLTSPRLVWVWPPRYQGNTPLPRPPPSAGGSSPRLSPHLWPLKTYDPFF